MFLGLIKNFSFIAVLKIRLIHFVQSCQLFIILDVLLHQMQL